MGILEGIKDFKYYSFLNKTIKKENDIKKYFQMSDNALSENAFNQVYNAREIIANFAKKNNVRVDICNIHKKDAKGAPILGEKILVIVNSLLKPKTDNRIITVDTNKVYPKYAYEKKVISENAFGEIKTVLGRHYQEDTFLRHLYRCIGELTENVSKKK